MMVSRYPPNQELLSTLLPTSTNDGGIRVSSPLYPSIESVLSEIPDLQVNERKLEVSSTHTTSFIKEEPRSGGVTRTKSWHGKEEPERRQRSSSRSPRRQIPRRSRSSKGELDSSSHHSATREKVAPYQRQSTYPLIDNSLHSNSSASSYGLSRQEQRDSHRRLSKARQHQAEKRRNHAASQAPKSPPRPPRRTSPDAERLSANPGLLDQELLQDIPSGKHQRPTSDPTLNTEETTTPEAITVRRTASNPNLLLEMTTEKRRSYDRIPTPGMRKESNHSSVITELEKPATIATNTKAKSCDSIPTPGLRTESAHGGGTRGRRQSQAEIAMVTRPDMNPSRWRSNSDPRLDAGTAPRSPVRTRDAASPPDVTRPDYAQRSRSDPRLDVSPEQSRASELDYGRASSDRRLGDVAPRPGTRKVSCTGSTPIPVATTSPSRDFGYGRPASSDLRLQTNSTAPKSPTSREAAPSKSPTRREPASPRSPTRNKEAASPAVTTSPRDFGYGRRVNGDLRLNVAPPPLASGSPKIYDSIPKPGLRKESLHSHVTPVPAPRKKKQCDSIPTPGMRKDSYHSSSVSARPQGSPARGAGNNNMRDQNVRSSSLNYLDGPPQRPQRRESVFTNATPTRKSPSPKRRTQRRHHSPTPPRTKNNYRNNNSDSMLLYDHVEEEAEHALGKYHPERIPRPTGRGTPSAPSPRHSRQDSLGGCTMHTISAMSTVSDITNPTCMSGWDMDEEDDIVEEMTAGPSLERPSFQRLHTYPRPSSGSSNKSKKNSSSRQRPLEVEIQPGVFMKLRGSEETQQAMNIGFVVQTTCMVCTLHVTCVADAEYVLCPMCKVVSPVENRKRGRGGVGLGVESGSSSC